jgi:hypothetical protein
MPHTKTTEALTAAARDTSRHITGLLDELHQIHNSRGANAERTAEDRQIDKIKDQIALLTAVVNDLSKAEHTT